MREYPMSRKLAVVFSIILLVIIIAVIGGIKAAQIGFMMESGASFAPPPETVSVTQVEEQNWPDTVSAVGSLEAWQGLMVSAEVNGRISAIHFESGQTVKAGDLLLEQESGNEQAQLRAALARLELAKSNQTRLASLRKQQSVSESALDEAAEQLESAQSEVQDLKTTLAKKRIVAPFAGRLGIRQVYLGQDLQAGTSVVTLQSIEQLRVNFRVPQQWLSKMQPGYQVRVGAVDSEIVAGEIIATAAEIDRATRNLHVQARIPNPNLSFLPGMSVGLEVALPSAQNVLAIPATAVLYAPYGDTVFVIEESDNGNESKTVRQQFVRLGATRGDFVSVEAGLTAGQKVVSAGAFKLFNGMPIVISKNPEPVRSLSPQPTDS